MFLLAFAESIQLFPDGTMFIHIGLILLMIWVLNRTYFKPINRVIESREKHMGVDGGEAGQIMRDAEEKRLAFNREMQAARSAGFEIVEKQRTEALAARQTEVVKVKDEAQRTLEAEKQALEAQMAEARAAIAAQADELAEKISSNILKA